MTEQEFKVQYGRKEIFGGMKRESNAPALPEYKAFESQAESQFRLWFRMSDANERGDFIVSYNSLRTWYYAEGLVLTITLQDDVMSVIELHGEGLEDVLRKLARHELVWIQEYDKRRFAPVSEGQAIVKAIKVSRKPGIGPEPEAIPARTH